VDHRRGCPGEGKRIGRRAPAWRSAKIERTICNFYSVFLFTKINISSHGEPIPHVPRVTFACCARACAVASVS
jgi:hypothetical protein